MQQSIRRDTFWLVVGALFSAAGVALGAFGAHGLESWLEGRVENPLHSVENWNTATRYLMYHALGILVVGLAAGLFGAERAWYIVGSLFVMGIMLFSGCLYTLSLTDLKFLGAIVPIGGLLMIAGWLTLAISLMFKTRHEN